MKKTAACLALVLLLFTASALEVSTDELGSVTNPDVITFINYTGPYTVINTKAQIASIGSELGTVIAGKEASETGSASRYSIIHATDDSVSQGLDADILILGPAVGVDHIRNLRTIISAYLTAAYGYSDTDASTLATFITVYNAVYRGKLDSVAGKYKQVVLDHLNAASFGLSVNFEDWPGKTQIVIPLHDPNREGLSIIDTTVISDSTVITSMREEDDRGVDERKNMVDLKEREADEAYEAAQQAQKEAVAAQKAAEEAKQAASEAATARDQAKEAAEEAKRAAEAQPENEEAQAVAEEKAEELTKAEETLKEAEETLVEAQETAKEKQATAAEEQAFSDKKHAETQAERTSIAQDQQKNLDEERASRNITTVWGLKMLKDGCSSIVFVDAATGLVVRESPVTLIRNRTLIQSEKGFAAIAGKKGWMNSTVRLVLIDPDTLEIFAQTVENVSEQAALIWQNGYFWTVIADGNSFYIGKYTEDLRLTARSEEPVNEATPITITQAGVIATGEDGAVVLLDEANLTKK